MKNSRKQQKQRKLRTSFFFISIAAVCCLFAVSFLLLQFLLPTRITLMQREEGADYRWELPFFLSVDTGDAFQSNFEEAVPAIDGNKPVICYEQGGSLHLHGSAVGEKNFTVRLFGFLPVKNVIVKVLPETAVYAGGDAIGLSLRAGGLVVVDFKNFCNGAGNICNPAKEAGLQRGDKILTCNGEAIADSDEFAGLVSKGAGKPFTLEYVRNGKTYRTSVTPQCSKEDGLYRLGMWVRDGTDGIGILTFVDGKTGRYGAIGHGIQDTDLEQLCDLDYGFAVNARIVGIQRGTSGEPGELKGIFDHMEAPLGNVQYQDDTGVYGACFMEASTVQALLTGREKLKVGLSYEVVTGPATILTTVGETGVTEYAIEIVQVYYNRVNSTKSMIIQVTDPALLEATGGIVQGMSGSPILQNGKLVGAVTHVLVNDPTKGYGIFIENMIEH